MIISIKEKKKMKTKKKNKRISKDLTNLDWKNQTLPQKQNSV